MHGYAPSVGSGTGYDGAYRCDKPAHGPRNVLILAVSAAVWSRVCEDEAASVEVEVARENHHAARLLSKRKPHQLSILHH